MPQTADAPPLTTDAANTGRRPEQDRQDCRQYFDTGEGQLTPRRHGRDRRPATAGGRQRGPAAILAFAAGDREAAIGQRLAALVVFARTRPDILAALRASRQAARAGARGYDPVRHAALCRLAKAAGAREPAEHKKGARGPKTGGRLSI
ncbi:hypothetical protein [Azorhizobium doebereinerae]|uniref:hypothetical protein n=1 Tax=Azorhizobium doebereinerae TaxID=281091 RepID=UPI00041C179F|nr:hypothetical protein [Azorhizobium doebereinerae]